MHTAVLRRYGPADTIEIQPAAVPVPGPGEILVRVASAGVTTADWRIRASAFPWHSWLPGRLMFGLTRPRHEVPGSDFAGSVVSAGAGVTRFRPGDKVYGAARHGAHADYLTIAADGAVAPMPEDLGFDGAAALPFGGLAARAFLKEFARLQPGERILIAGATGGVGVYAVQIARFLGAHVTALARGDKADLARSLGAHEVIDYRRGSALRGTERYDVVLDTAGVLPWKKARRVLEAGGRYVPLEFGLGDVLRSLTDRFRRGRTVIAVSGESAAALDDLSAMIAAGALRPVIDSRFPLARIAEAHARVEGRHKTGAVVLTMQPEETAVRAA